LYQTLLRESSFFDLLYRLDKDLAEEARARGCECGGALHGAWYPRKPRGGPPDLSPEHAMRLSFCCAKDGCRRRMTPASLRFLGRKVFFGVIVLLVPVLRDGPTPKRLERLCAEFAVSPRTVRRWVRWWRETFATSRFWQARRGWFAQPVISEALPSSWCAAFGGVDDAPSWVLMALRFLAPITTGKGLLSPAI
jgi:hypothetical protein